LGALCTNVYHVQAGVTTSVVPESTVRASGRFQILGIMLGVANIPNRWLNMLEPRVTIRIMSRDFYAVGQSDTLSISVVDINHGHPPN